MPIIKSAKKRVRQTAKRTTRRSKQKSAYKKLTKQLKKGATTKAKGLVSKMYSKIDRAAGKRIISKKKASRLKSKLA